MALVKAYRTHGHLAARLDPLGSEPPGDPSLEPERMDTKLTPELQARIPARLLRTYVEGETLADALPRLQETYCETIAYEVEHISDLEERVWLREAIESGRYRQPLTDEEELALLTRLTEVGGLETYLRKAFLGQKQFSIEGLDVLVPMLDEAITLAAEGGAHEAVIGMAHRGRLNVLAHVIGRPYETILREFEGERMLEAISSDSEGGTGDVKYHLGAHGKRVTPNGEINVTLAANPSHLEAVDPVVEGRTRADQTDRSTREGLHDPSVALAILIHGDAAFPAQGVVAETLNLSYLDGYATGGTLHLISNNQVGFTTEPEEGRSTRYSSDLAKGFDAPIIHVNADDPEAAISAVRLALAFRRRFCNDVVIDLVGYRRHGHNEQDEAAYTQPLMAARILRHPPVREQFAQRLEERGIVTAGGGRAARLGDDRGDARGARPAQGRDRRVDAASRRGQACRRTSRPTSPRPSRPSACARSTRSCSRCPRASPSIRSSCASSSGARRRSRREASTGARPSRSRSRRSWSRASPCGSRGQDTERGTFSHRHLVLHDAKNGQRWTPIQRLPDATASFEVFNSPLSEYACVGFEYGYSIAAPDALVLWEAQFGDFVNGAQIVIDQFISSGRSKWGETSRLTLLLPHGYEGNGPEHSSARAERFLQLAAQNNIRIANCTTAAQYFHLLRRQALTPVARPLVVLTPKGLLRLKEASSTLQDLADGSFRPVLDDSTVEPGEVTRLVLCSGKVYYDVVGHEARAGARHIAVGRLEQLYPFPVDAVGRARAHLPEPARRSCGCRRSRRTWGRGAPSATGSRARRPACRCVTSAGPGARHRRRAIRPRTGSSRTGSLGTLFLSGALGLRRGRGGHRDPRAVLAGRAGELPSLRRRAVAARCRRP